MSTLSAPTVGQAQPAGSTVGPHQVQVRSKDGRYVLTGMSGPEPAETTEGRGGFEEVPRNRRPPITQWVGSGARKTTVTLWVDAWAAQKSIESTLTVVDGLAPPVPAAEPSPVFVVGAPGIPSTVPWVIQGVTISERLRLPNGRTARAQVAFDLLEWRPGDVVVVRPSATKRSVVRHGKPTAGKPRTYTVHAGDTLSKIAAKCLGKSSRWPEITLANGSKIRNPNNLKAGTVLRLPA